MNPKILHVLASAHLGGAERMCLMLAAEQQRRGHDVALYLFQPGAVQASFERAGIPVFLADASTIPPKDKPSFRRAAAFGLAETLKSWQPSLVHSHVPLTNLICNRVLRRSSIPWVATIHGSWKQFGYAPETVGRPYLKPYLMCRYGLGTLLTTTSAARLITPDQSTKRSLQAIGISESRIRVVNNGLPPLSEIIPKAEARAKLGLETDVPVIGSLGYFAPVKGFDLLIRAFGQLQKRGITAKLIIAGGEVLGNTATRASLENLIRSEHLEGKAQLIGPLDSATDFLAALDIYVVSSRTEGMSLALVQAMQHGLPSVVSSEGGSSEAARPEIESLVFRSGDVADLAEKLEILIKDASRREAIGRAAAARASGHLTLTRCAGDYDSVYEEILSGSHKIT